MRKDDCKQLALPDAPGVYTFKNARGQRLYIGKATNLKERVRSYCNADLLTARGPLLVKMLEEASTVTWEVTDSVLDALILEANSIKKFQPPYNTKEKSNKSFNYVIITNEEYPRVLTMRGRELQESQGTAHKEVFGPFPQGSALRDALKIVRKIFPYRDKCLPEQSKPCFNYQIGLCPGVCAGEVSAKEYAQTIKHITLLFGGKKGTLIAHLERDMRRAAREEHFEEAARMRNQVYALEHINDIALTKGEVGQTLARIEGYDVAHISETNRVGVMTVIEDGEPSKGEYKKFKIKTPEQGDVAALKELLMRRLEHGEWPLPNLIVVDGGKAQINAARKILQKYGHPMPVIPVAGVVKDEKHKPKGILGDAALTRVHEGEILKVNAEAHRFAINYHKKLRNKVR